MQVLAIVFFSQVQSHKHTDFQGSTEVSERVISVSTIPIDFNEVSDINRIMNPKQLNLLRCHEPNGQSRKFKEK
ncbi:hypothetical protein Leryth_001979 [Lithospermum erythrorhizon]|nr:hypothetical protein Leryth_001979 [Lithospermum erythrorhizon]